MLDKRNTFTLWIRQEKNIASVKANRSSQLSSPYPGPPRRPEVILTGYLVSTSLWEENGEKSWGNKHRPHGVKIRTWPWRCWGLWAGDWGERPHSGGLTHEMPWAFLTQSQSRTPLAHSGAPFELKSSQGWGGNCPRAWLEAPSGKHYRNAHCCFSKRP